MTSFGRVGTRPTKQMREIVAKIRREQGASLNRQVADLFRDNGGVGVRENVKKLGGRRLERSQGQDLGDIDVLVVDPVHRAVLAIETKNFSSARTPFELSNEVDNLYRGDRSATNHHWERLCFLEANLDCLENLEPDRPRSRRDWQIRGLHRHQ